MNDTVHVELGARSYDIQIGPGLIGETGRLLRPYLDRARVAVITDENVAALHLENIINSLEQQEISVSTLILPAGEGTKSWPHFTHSVDWLLEEQIERNDMVIALGGGVIGDLAGFAAAVLRRGVRFVQVPTSLLAQVDSSVGGKTGINSRHGKNLIGAFHQPALVVADTDALRTLPERDFLAGNGEVMKYGLLGDYNFFQWLEEHSLSFLSRDPDTLAIAVRRSCEIKAAIVARDETEQGDRALLNLGHTFCHALEAATGYSERLLHGEGVAIGCALAFEVSARMGLCSQEDPSRLRAYLHNMKMKSQLSDIPSNLPSSERLIQLMHQDKKVRDGQIHFVMARGIGQAFVTPDVDLDIVRQVLDEQLADKS
ncbi:MAG: 3-dehydroquinate synthase [Rhodobacteraceae bacterium HLUCCO07]|nr:MAG: 3-dehydroquinate synthase [Rhodobacteraceae bacterium HLUCCO07]